MEMSTAINELAGALAKAQGAIEGAKRTADNPYFKSKYAELSEVWDTIRQPLADNGLAVVQTMSGDESKLTLTSLLAHSSGQWIKDSITLPVDPKPQSLGSATTYMRRYGLMALVGVAPEDDDAETAMGRPRQKPSAQVPAPSKQPTDTAHFCKEHNTQFFKKGAMKSFAHPVKNPDGSDVLKDGKALWCYEHTADSPKEPPASTSSPTEPDMKTLGDLAAWAWKQGVNQKEMLNLLGAKVLSDIKDITAAKQQLTNWIITRDSQASKAE